MTAAGNRGNRAELIADTALTLLAQRGMRGLTHRAVDEAAGLPLGSTSNYARTRAALLGNAVTRLVELESALVRELWAEGFPAHRETMVDILAATLHQLLTTDREHTVARFELALEATRRPPLRAVYERAAHTFLTPLTRLLARLGSLEPERHARSLLSWMEGTAFISIAAGWVADPPSQEVLHRGMSELLDGLLGPEAKITGPTAPPASS